MKNKLLLCAVFCLNLLSGNIFSLNNIKKYLPEDPVIVECGAHIGFHTVRMSKLWPQGFIHAIEASPNVFLKLKKRTRRLGNVKRYNLALGDENGEALFYVAKKIEGLDENHGGNYAQGSLLAPNPTEWVWDHIVMEDAPITVAVLTLDEWAKRNQIEKVDFMWLDMQGSDFNMLMQSSTILDTVKVIQIEISSKEIYKGTVLFDEGRAFLEDHGFELIATKASASKTFKEAGHGDALFIRKELLSESDRAD